MNKEFLLGNLFLRLSAMYWDSARRGFLNSRRNHKRRKTEAEDPLEKAPWKLELLSRYQNDSATPEPASRESHTRKKAA